MQLSAQLFEQIIHSIRTETGSRHEKRVSPRVGLRYVATFRPVGPRGAGPKESVRVRDLSETGICILYTKSVQRDQQFLIELPRTGDEILCMLCDVKYARPVGTGFFCVGAAFSKAVPPPVEETPAAAVDGDHLTQIQRALSKRS